MVRHQSIYGICGLLKSHPQIPLYALFKVWTFTVGPMFGFGAPKADVAAEADASAGQPATSKRQEKLKKRSEKGDPRVKAQTVRSR